MTGIDYSLYYIADAASTSTGEFERILEDALKGGITLVQLRAKKLTSLEFLAIALKVRRLSRRYDVPFIVNDRIDIALASQADGVHLGKEDTPLRVARKVLGKRAIIGRTVRSLEEALEADKEGASYLSLGSIFPTRTKVVPKIVGPQEIRKIKRRVKLPLVAIGGINIRNARVVIESGADGIAVVSAIASRRNPFMAAVRLRKLIHAAKRGLESSKA